MMPVFFLLFISDVSYVLWSFASVLTSTLLESTDMIIVTVNDLKFWTLVAR